MAASKYVTALYQSSTFQGKGIEELSKVYGSQYVETIKRQWLINRIREIEIFIEAHWIELRYEVERQQRAEHERNKL